MKLQEFALDSIPNIFWDAIVLAQQDYERFRTLLKQMNRRELIRFYWNYREAAAQFKWELYTDVLLSVMSELSEDTLDDICNWIVGKGKEYYTQIFYNPELMPNEIDNRDSALEILGEVIDEYDERYGESIPLNPKYVVEGFYGYQDFTPDEFWNLIDLAHQDKEGFHTLVKQMECEDLIEFYSTYIQAANKLKAAPYLNIITSTKSMPSAADLDDICKWVVAQGKEHYREVYYVPELMPCEIDEPQLGQSLLSPAIEEYEERYNELIPYKPKYRGLYDEFTLDEIPEDRFWEFIEVARQDEERFYRVIKEMNREELIDFYWIYELAISPFKDEAYIKIITTKIPILSESDLDDISKWVVAQGKEYYAEIFDNPELIPSSLNDRLFAQRLLKSVMKEYEERYGESILDAER